MRTSHARRPLHTQCELSRTNQGLLVAEMRFAAARAVTYATRRRHRRQISSLDQGAARKWGGAKMAKWACRPVAAPHPAGRRSAPLRPGRAGRRQAIFGLMSLSAFPTVYILGK